MKFKEYQIVFAAVFAPLVLLWGCKSNQLVSPTHVVNLGVSLSTAGIKSKLFSTGEDAVYYNISGPATDPIEGFAGDFYTNYGSGSISFTLNNIPVGPNEILSVEIDDATSGYAQGIGAASLASIDNGVTIEMGSLVRNCYSVAPSTNFSCLYGFNGTGSINFNQAYVGYDGLGLLSNFDMKWVSLLDSTESCTGNYDLVNAWTGSGGTAKNIAYLGNNDGAPYMVNYDTVPPDAQFYTSGGAAKAAAQAPTTVIQADDVFCIKLQGGTVPGHAWVLFNSAGDAQTAPTFSFRVRNDSTPYYSYDVGTVDLQDTTNGYSNCGLSEETYYVP
ncbi:MAG TPA: hypothetical protein VMU88_08570 [bacterium]|nr:hypothetical protein [bacterium]